MLKTKVKSYCGLGENCSRVILRAASEEYGFSLSEDILAACGGINGGFGIGGICSGLVASVMVLGLLFDEEEIKWKRILFLMSVQERYGSLECGRLSALQTDCKEILEGIADILQEVIEE